jgi:hypothetical protein
MTPEELNAHHRDFVVNRLLHQSVLVKNLMVADDPTELSRFILENGSVLSEHGLASPEEAPRLNNVFTALYRNTELEEWSWQFLEIIQTDQKAGEILRIMNFAPETVTADQFRYLYDTYIAEQDFVVKALEIILRDPDFRKAMDLEDDISVAEFRRRSLDYASISETYEDFQRTAKQYGYFGPFICTATVCAVAVLFVFAFTTVGVSPVTCVSGNTVLSSVARMIPSQGDRLQSLCINHSTTPAWVIVKGHSGFKRVSLGADDTSRDLDLLRVEAIVIGGRGNSLARVALPNGETRTSGCYVLACNAEDPAVVTIEETASGEVALTVNDAQRLAESAGMAGYSSTELDTVAGYADVRFAMDGATAALPPTMDRARLARLLAFSERYTNTLRIVNWLNTAHRLRTRSASPSLA